MISDSDETVQPEDMDDVYENYDLSDDEEDIPNAQPLGQEEVLERWTTYRKQVSTENKVKCAIL